MNRASGTRGARATRVGRRRQVSVPLTFGMFKQTASVPAGWLEPHVEAAAGGPQARVVYNKGL